MGELGVDLGSNVGRMVQDGSVSQVMTVDNFLTGLVSVCALEGIKALTLRGQDFFEAMEAAYAVIDEAATAEGIEVRFAVFLDPIYGDSPVIREAISMAVTRKLVSLDNPEYQEMRIKFGQEEARLLLASLPGSIELYKQAAGAFLDRHLVPA